MDNDKSVWLPLQLKGGWNGGTWVVNGTEKLILSSVRNNDIVRLKIKDKIYEAKVFAYSGTDDDHGHTYSWSNHDFSLEVTSDLGLLKVSLRSIIDDLPEILIQLPESTIFQLKRYTY